MGAVGVPVSMQAGGMMRNLVRGMAAAAMSSAFVMLGVAPAEAVPIARVSVAQDGSQGTGSSDQPSMSADGRYVAFTSRAALTMGVSGGTNQIYVKDRRTGAVEVASASTLGAAGDGGSFLPVMSANGRYVAFSSYASNLVPGASGQLIYLRDRAMGTTTLVASGDQTGGVSDDGRLVVFSSYSDGLVPNDANQNGDVFVRHMDTATTDLVSVGLGGNSGNSYSTLAVDISLQGALSSISADGRYVTFNSTATDLVTGDTTAGFFGRDAFVRDLQSGTTTRVSVGPSGAQANAPSIGVGIAAQGRYISFASTASNLAAGGTGNGQNIYVYDLNTGVLQLAGRTASGGVPSGPVFEGALSGDGRHLVYASTATDVVPGDTNGKEDVFVRDLDSGTVTKVSVDTGGQPANGSSFYPRISGDGSNVTFTSIASNLVADDTNGANDVFAHGTLRRHGTFVCRAAMGTLPLTGDSAPVANPGATPCIAQASSNALAASSTAQTPADPASAPPASGDGVSAQSTLADLALTVAGISIRVRSAVSTATATCNAAGGLDLQGTSSVGFLQVAGRTIATGGGPQTVNIPLVGTLYVNRTVVTGTVVTQRAVWLHTVLGADVVLGESVAGGTGTPCN